MARGYPQPKEHPLDVLDLLPEEVCIICKRRRALQPGGFCPTCAETLGAPARSAG